MAFLSTKTIGLWQLFTLIYKAISALNNQSEDPYSLESGTLIKRFYPGTFSQSPVFVGGNAIGEGCIIDNGFVRNTNAFTASETTNLNQFDNYNLDFNVGIDIV